MLETEVVSSVNVVYVVIFAALLNKTYIMHAFCAVVLTLCFYHFFLHMKVILLYSF